MKLLKRLVVFLVALAAIYLITVNLLLARPETQAFINGLKPERVAVTWQSAWSWYPLRLELQGVHADGQSRREQWQVEAPRAAASISLLPLLSGQIHVHDIDLHDADLRLRKRPRPDRDDAERREHFPPIANRDPDAMAEPKPIGPKKKGLEILVDDLRLHGEHAVWIGGLRGTLVGAIAGRFSIQTNGGRMALADAELDVTLRSLEVFGVEDASTGAKLRGRLDIPPLFVSELLTREGFDRIDFDLNLDLPVNNLDFLKILIGDLGDIAITGEGRVSGRVHQADGDFKGDTDLRVEASKLLLAMPPYAFAGDGLVRIKLDPSDPKQGDLNLRFGSVQGLFSRVAEQEPLKLFVGRDLEANLHLTKAEPAAPEVDLRLRIPEVGVPDLALYNALIPAKAGLELLGGEGSLAATLDLNAEGGALSLELGSQAAAVRLKEYRGSADLGIKLRASAKRGEQAILDIAGTELRLDDARLAKSDSDAAEAAPWSASLSVASGELEIPLPTDDKVRDALAKLKHQLKQQGLGSLLDAASGRLDAKLDVSGLDWIAHLLGRPQGLSLSGQGEVAAELILSQGDLQPGTTLSVQPEGLTLGLLQHVIAGKGTAALSIEQDGAEPDLRLAVRLADASMRRADEDQASVEQVALEADILVPAAKQARKTPRVDIKIPSARITDMSAFNAYLPENAPVKVVSGEASLIGELHTGADKVHGELLLEGVGLGVALDEVSLSGDLQLIVLIGGGAPEELRFDVTGSSLLLDNFDVVGATASHDGARWGARLQLGESQMVWTKPMQLSTEATLTVTDTRPFVAMLENARGEHHWIDDLLTLKDMTGHLNLTIDERGALIEDAFLGADKASISAKGLSRKGHREALLLVGIKRLAGTLALNNGERYFKILGARDRFASYVPGQTELPERGIDVSPKDKKKEKEEQAEAPAAQPAEQSTADKVRGQSSGEPKKKQGENLFLDGGF